MWLCAFNMIMLFQVVRENEVQARLVVVRRGWKQDDVSQACLRVLMSPRPLAGRWPPAPGCSPSAAGAQPKGRSRHAGQPEQRDSQAAKSRKQIRVQSKVIMQFCEDEDQTLAETVDRTKRHLNRIDLSRLSVVWKAVGFTRRFYGQLGQFGAMTLMHRCGHCGCLLFVRLHLVPLRRSRCSTQETGSNWLCVIVMASISGSSQTGSIRFGEGDKKVSFHRPEPIPAGESVMSLQLCAVRQISLEDTS